MERKFFNKNYGNMKIKEKREVNSSIKALVKIGLCTLT
jgi:hypothetical protein